MCVCTCVCACARVCVCVCKGSPVSPGSLMTSGDLSSLSPTRRSGCSCGTLRDRSASGASSPVTSATPPWPWLSTTSQVSQSFDSSLPLPDLPSSAHLSILAINKSVCCVFVFWFFLFFSRNRHELLPANVKVDRGRADGERK